MTDRAEIVDEAIEDILQTVYAYDSDIAELKAEIAHLRKPYTTADIACVLTAFVLVYVYGAFLGVYMCPK